MSSPQGAGDEDFVRGPTTALSRDSRITDVLPCPAVTTHRHRVTVHTDDGVRLSGVVVPGVGHAESGATGPLVERTGRWASATINP
jgi:hypothetical protein